MSNHLRLHRGPERAAERLAKICICVAISRVDRLPPPQRPGEYRRLLLAVGNNIGDPAAAARSVADLLDDGVPVAA